jgi:enoyl-CoA hydratase/carnithine racemase
MAAELKSRSEGRTMVLTLSNPEHRNALGPEIYAAGVEALNAADSNPEVRSVVITGAGTTFCAGGNLQRLLDNRRKPPEVQAQSIEGLHAWIEAIRTFPKPVIAAVEGAAAGAGFSLALACDFIVAADDAVFVMAYSSVALSPDGGGTWSLARTLPRHSLEEALALAARLNERAPNALASIKELLNDAGDTALTRQLAAERDHFVRNLHHGNAGIGIAAFLSRQPPLYP